MKTLARFFGDLKKYNKYIWTSALSELRSEVANSYLNWLWWILEPLAFMLIYTFIFGTVFGNSEPHFSLFVFIGLTMWTFFNRTLMSSVGIIRQSRTIIKKVYLPKFVLVLRLITVNFLKMLFSIGIIIMMMIYYQVRISWDVLYVIPIFFIFLLFTFGMSLIFAHFGVFISDLKNVTRIGLRMVFYLSGIFFNVEKRLPAPYGFWLARINPIAFLLNAIRELLLKGNIPDYRWMIVWAVVGLGSTIVGIQLIYKNENTYVKVI